MLSSSIAAVLTVLAIASASAQTTTPVPAKNLNDDFAISAIKALRSIEGETGETQISNDGHLLVPRETGDILDDLDARAQTPAEAGVVKTLHTFWMAKLDHNVAIDTASIMVSNMLMVRGEGRSPVKIADHVSRLPTVFSMHTKQTNCGEQLEGALRARTFSTAPLCSKDELTVDTPTLEEVKSTF